MIDRRRLDGITGLKVTIQNHCRGPQKRHPRRSSRHGISCKAVFDSMSNVEHDPIVAFYQDIPLLRV